MYLQLTPPVGLIGYRINQSAEIKMSVLTPQEREAALRQVTGLDVLNSATAKHGRPKRYVPITHDGKEIWVSVDPLDEIVSTNVPQPDPERQALYGGENQYGCPCYCYADQLPTCITCSLIFTVAMTILFTPLSLICCIPMIQHLQKVSLCTHMKCMTKFILKLHVTIPYIYSSYI